MAGRQNGVYCLLQSSINHFKRLLRFIKSDGISKFFFKECKQYPGLGTNQSRDFGVQIADATHAFMTHCMLTLQKRFSDYETFGELFKETQEELCVTTLWQRILAIITYILELISHELNRTYEEVLQLLWRDEEIGKQICTLFSLIPHGKAS